MKKSIFATCLIVLLVLSVAYGLVAVFNIGSQKTELTHHDSPNGESDQVVVNLVSLITTDVKQALTSARIGGRLRKQNLETFATNEKKLKESLSENLNSCWKNLRNEANRVSMHHTAAQATYELYNQKSDGPRKYVSETLSPNANLVAGLTTADIEGIASRATLAMIAQAVVTGHQQPVKKQRSFNLTVWIIFLLGLIAGGIAAIIFQRLRHKIKSKASSYWGASKKREQDNRNNSTSTARRESGGSDLGVSANEHQPESLHQPTYERLKQDWMSLCATLSAPDNHTQNLFYSVVAILEKIDKLQKESTKHQRAWNYLADIAVELAKASNSDAVSQETAVDWLMDEERTKKIKGLYTWYRDNKHKVEKYDTLKKQLETLEAENVKLNNDLRQQDTKIEQMTNEISNLTRKRDKLQNDNHTLDAKVDNLTNELDTAIKKCNSIQSSADKAHEQVSRALGFGQVFVRSSRLQGDVVTTLGADNSSAYAINYLVNYCIASLMQTVSDENNFRGHVMLSNLYQIASECYNKQISSAGEFMKWLSKQWPDLATLNGNLQPKPGQWGSDVLVVGNALTMGELSTRFILVGENQDLYYVRKQ